MIVPTTGRVVHFRPNGSFGFAHTEEQPLAAHVCHVHHDRMVNLMVIDSNGIPHGVTSVTLLQDADVAPETGYYCEWMDYQKGQAAKTEAAEAVDALLSRPAEDKPE